MLARPAPHFPQAHRGLPGSQWKYAQFRSPLRTRGSLSRRLPEEEDERIYGDFADGLRENYPATADLFEGMRKEEAGHRRLMIRLRRPWRHEQLMPRRLFRCARGRCDCDPSPVW